jgi:hypothetical protein
MVAAHNYDLNAAGQGSRTAFAIDAFLMGSSLLPR